jgi:hypothetical protein
MKFRRFLLGAVIMACCGMPAGAAELELPRPKAAPTTSADKPPSPARTDATVYNYGKSDSTCAAWTDGCVNCIRGENDQNQCSNIGPACQPKSVRCTSHK